MLTDQSGYGDQGNSYRPTTTTSGQPDTNYVDGPTHSSRSTDFTRKKFKIIYQFLGKTIITFLETGPLIAQHGFFTMRPNPYVYVGKMP